MERKEIAAMPELDFREGPSVKRIIGTDLRPQRGKRVVYLGAAGPLFFSGRERIRPAHDAPMQIVEIGISNGCKNLHGG